MRKHVTQAVDVPPSRKRSPLAWASPWILALIWLIAVIALAFAGDWETLRRIPYYWLRKAVIVSLGVLAMFLLKALYRRILGPHLSPR